MSNLARVQPAELSTNSSTITNPKSSIGGATRINIGKPVTLKSSATTTKAPNATQPRNITAQPKSGVLIFAKRSTDRVLDAIYFLCPDCTVVQCSAIFLGFMLVAILTATFLIVAGYWE